MELNDIVKTKELRFGDKGDPVRKLQEALGDRYEGPIDGDFGPATRRAVRALQEDYSLPATGIADAITVHTLLTDDPPDEAVPSIALRKLARGAAPELSEESLRRMWPDGKVRLVTAMAATAPDALAMAGINNPRRLAHFMAQLSHECGGGTVTEENLNYSARRMTEVWPSRFPTIESAQPYSHDPKALANKVYNGRMGNRADSSDGWNYRGRGLVQITGRDGYQKVGERAGLDLFHHPEMANDPKTALQVAAAFWMWKDLNDEADRDDLEAITRKVNGGLNGLAERQAWLKRWKHELGI